MKILINNNGEVSFPIDEKQDFPGFTVMEVTPEIQAVLDQGGLFKWVPNDPDDPNGDGILTKVAPSVTVPSEIEPAQLREWLIRNGKLEAVNAALDAIPNEGEKAVMKSWFEFAVTIRRNNPKIAAIAQALSMTDEEVDLAFVEASKF